MTAYVFPGQGAQFSGMGKNLYESSDSAKQMFDKANEILGFDITKIMFEGSDEELKQTNVTQPAIFLHSVILASTIEDFKPDMVAGHSLGEFSALVAAGALSFEDGLKLVSQRADAMQRACQITPSTMAAILNLDDKIVEDICASIDGIVVPANYNCPGQLVISGSIEAVTEACEQLKAAGAKRALILPVGGAFHSPLMEPAREELAKSNSKYNIFYAIVSDLPKCKCTAFERCGSYKSKFNCSIDSPCSLDAIGAKYGSRWCNKICRMWARKGFTRFSKENRSARNRNCGGIIIMSTTVELIV